MLTEKKGFAIAKHFAQPDLLTALGYDLDSINKIVAERKSAEAL